MAKPKKAAAAAPAPAPVAEEAAVGPRFRYVGDCEAGEVRFEIRHGKTLVMPYGVAVVVDHEPLAAKLAQNPAFEAVEDAPATEPEPQA